MHTAPLPNTPSIVDRIVRGISTQGIGSLPGKVGRLAHKIWRQSTFKPYVITKNFSGERFEFWLTDLWAEDWYLSDERQEEACWLRGQLKEGDLFVDCGSHHGLFAILASRWVGASGSVIAIEALPQNAAVLAKNLVQNRITNVRVVNAAASSTSGKVFVEHRKFGFLHDSNGVIRAEPHDGTVEVERRTIDQIIGEGSPSVIKIDVEGHEIEVLRGMTEQLDRRPSLDLELHCSLFQDAIQSVKDLLQLLPISAYDGFIQLEVDDRLVEYDPRVHTPEVISSHVNVHLFLTPRERPAA